jgi:hypothetical protein
MYRNIALYLFVTGILETQPLQVELEAELLALPDIFQQRRLVSQNNSDQCLRLVL